MCVSRDKPAIAKSKSERKSKELKEDIESTADFN
jgi:hypothetical protein